MNAISPFSLIDKLGAGKAVGAAASFIADAARDTARDATRPGGPLGTAFSEVWDRLDANKDGRVTGGDALGHAVKAGAWTFDTVGRAMGLEMDRGGNSRAAAPGPDPLASGLTTPAQMMLAEGQRAPEGPGSAPAGAPYGAPLSAPGQTTVSAPPAADLTALEAIRATYQALRAARF